MRETKIIGFHLPTEEYGCFSNWYPAKFTYGGLSFSSAEQYMMYHKVMLGGRYDLARQIMGTDDPSVIKELAGAGAFPEFAKIKNKWHWICRVVVRRAVYAKFMQNPEMRSVLLSTGNALLCECSRSDTIWGIGINLHDTRWKKPENWNGTNFLGNILMEVRDEIRQLVMSTSGAELLFEDAMQADANEEWLMTAKALINHPAYEKSVKGYVDTFANNFARQSFMDAGITLSEWEKRVRDGESVAIPVLGFFDLKQDVYDISRRLHANARFDRIHAFCGKYMIMLDMIRRDAGLRSWAIAYAPDRKDDVHADLAKMIYGEFMGEAKACGLMPADYYETIDQSALDIRMISNPDDAWIRGLSRKELIACVAWHFRADYFAGGALLRHSIGDGVLIRFFEALLGQ